MFQAGVAQLVERQPSKLNVAGSNPVFRSAINKMLRFFFFLLICQICLSQTDYRTWLRGKVSYQNSNVISANVINTSTEKATITDENGEFAIEVMLNDELLFTSLQYKIRSVRITKEILQKSRLVIDVNEKVTELDEVVVTPSQRQKFLDLKSEEFKKFDYNRDKSTRVENVIQRQNQLYNGINFVNVYKALSKLVSSKSKQKNSQISLKPSEVIVQLFDEFFFINELKIEKDNIGQFLIYCDDNIKINEILGNKSNFEIMDFLIKSSLEFKKKYK